ncbi:MAG: ATP-dependent helicase [Candidatus Dormibacteraeota bacterium]|nr:ATP-dependent helicase [Candidatus Dormibacteraeota bacterium]
MSTLLTSDTFDGPVRVLAGPGTGKTKLLVDLYADLVRSGRAARGEVLVLTFSTAAAEEIGRRVDDQLPESYDESWIGTFHSFCARLLREHRPDPGSLVMSGFQEWLAMKTTLAELDPAALGPLGRVAHTDTFAQDALAFVAMLKQNRVHSPELALQAEADGTPRLRALAAVYAAYQRRCRGVGLRDFRDLVNDAAGLLEARPDLLQRYRRKFSHLLVDEFQDVDPAQFHLLTILAPPATSPRILVVGDPDQSIYGFRGTVPSLLAETFPNVYGGRSLSLDVSHRCPPEVLEAGRQLLQSTQPGRPARSLTSAGPAAPGSVRLAREAGPVDEAFYVAREIRRLMLEDPSRRPRHFAVLLRSTASLAVPFEEAIRAMGLPYEVRGVGTLARNEVVRFLLSYLRAVAEPDDPESMERLLGSGLSGVGRRTVGRLRRYALEEGRPFTRVVRRLLYWLNQGDPAAFPLPWAVPGEGEAPAPGEASFAPAGDPMPSSRPGESQGEGADATPEPPPPPSFAEPMSRQELESFHQALTTFYEAVRRSRRLPLAALAYWVLIDAGVMARLLDLALEESERADVLAQLRAALDAFSQLDEVWEKLHQDRPPMVADVARRLDAYIARAVDDAQPASPQQDAVQVLTVHQSKGLEFDHVFLSGFAEGIFPLAARPHPLLEEDDQRWLQRRLDGFIPSWPADAAEHLAEEARLAYVGMTRARRRLCATYADTYDSPAGRSPFCEPALQDVPVSELSRARVRLDPGSLLTTREAETLLAGGSLQAAQLERLGALDADLAFLTDPEAGRHFEPYHERPREVAPDHFSPTALNDYLKCPRLYWYNHHPGLARSPRGVEMERGSFLHEVLEEFHTREDEWRRLSPDDQRGWLDAVLEEKLQGYLDRQEAVLERRAEEQEVRRILGNYVRFATSSQPIRRLGTLMVERKFRLQLDGAEIHGKIDRVNDTGDGTCEVVDYKTGRGKPAGRAYEEYFGPELSDVQLLMYYLACRDGLDEEGRPIALEPRFLSLWYPKDMVYGQMRQVLFTLGEPPAGLREWLQRTVGPEDLERGRRAVLEAIGRIRDGDFAPAPRNLVGTCLSWFGCPHAAICPYGGTPVE